MIDWAYTILWLLVVSLVIQLYLYRQRLGLNGITDIILIALSVSGAMLSLFR